MNRHKRTITNSTLLLVTTLVCLAILEFASRMILPISPGVRNLDLDGHPVLLSGSNPHRLPASLEFRQVSAEFDVTVTTTPQGNRVPASIGSLHTVILGDSFTFGQGLSDEETFAHIFCKEARVSCVNLSRNGIGTGSEVDILRHYIESEGWRPKRVMLFMLAMSGSMMAGNDLQENLHYNQSKKVEEGGTRPASTPKPEDRGINLRNRILGSSNLARIAYFQLAPFIRSNFSPAVDADYLSEVYEATEFQLNRFDKLSKEFGFDYRIYVLHPMQDIMRGTDGETIAAVSQLASGAKVVATSHLFKKEPQKFYYAYDGHFNALGSRRMAEFLLREENW